jgi:hypothetical protein
VPHVRLLPDSVPKSGIKGENYALKLAAGYVLHPSHENDSYYFLKKL